MKWLSLRKPASAAYCRACRVNASHRLRRKAAQGSAMDHPVSILPWRRRGLVGGGRDVVFREGQRTRVTAWPAASDRWSGLARGLAGLVEHLFDPHQDIGAALGQHRRRSRLGLQHPCRAVGRDAPGTAGGGNFVPMPTPAISLISTP